MHWSMVGWSHHHTPIELRERLAFSTEQAAQVLQQLGERYPDSECVLLSTCNRVEAYCGAEQPEQLPGSQQLGALLAGFHQLDYPSLRPQALELDGTAVIQHLFKVAASLDSMIVGEAQIQAQVRGAYDLACQQGRAGSLMHRVFQRATAVARRVANETTIQQRRISVPSVAVSEIATEFFESFDDKKILLIGAGDMGVETVRYLQDAGARQMWIVNRSFTKAQELAEQFSLQAEPWDLLDLFLAEADLIISTTSSPEMIVSTSQFRRVRSGRQHAVLILDLAVPRDFDPAIANLPDTYLYSIDDLQQVCQRNMQARQAQWPKAMQIIEQETQKFMAESRHAGSGPTIKRLQDQAQQIKQEEFKRLLDKLRSHDLDPAVQQELSHSFDRLINKLLHPPLQSLRDHADSTHHATLLDSLRRLFQIND
ncbi:MAG: glutamyl-tRNA reductase [Pirellulaceae bacterium]|nr:glutamyl-tRNA reductase [Pirellulaceae bacterium]